MKPVNNSLFFALLISITQVAACAPLPRTSPAVNTDTSHARVRTADSVVTDKPSVLEFIGNFVELPEEAQRLQLKQINQTLVANKYDHYNKMKLAMIYAYPTSRLHNTVKAQSLLDELQREKTLDVELHSLATLLRDNINENRLTQKLREEQKRADLIQQKLDALQLKAEGYQLKIDDLERKLLELKNIEKTMGGRDTGTPK